MTPRKKTEPVATTALGAWFETEYPEITQAFSLITSRLNLSIRTVEKLARKLEEGARVHGPKSLGKTSAEFQDEIEAERLDIIGWHIVWLAAAKRQGVSTIDCESSLNAHQSLDVVTIQGGSDADV